MIAKKKQEIMMAYNIVDIETGQVLDMVEELPTSIPRNAVLVELDTVDIKSRLTSEINEMK